MKKKLPQFERLTGTFLGRKFDGSFVALAIGGMVLKNYQNPGQPEYKNTCALRVSRALNYAGDKIPYTNKSPRVNSGREKFWYIYSVNDLEGYLRLKYGDPDIHKKGKSNGDITAADFDGEKGIILFKSYHVDLWNGADCEGHCYFPNVSEVMLWRAP